MNGSPNCVPAVRHAVDVRTSGFQKQNVEIGFAESRLAPEDPEPQAVKAYCDFKSFAESAVTEGFLSGGTFAIVHSSYAFA
jgi:hypothetical protein